ncbi:MAG TPA: glycosyltransferase family 4 protein, partial [Bacteroidales bacterium]|nr:glycosyltransferase family 4 protein [Bacteroidales bacterium]
HHGMVYGHYYLAREWVKMGHEVTIVASSYAHTRFRQPAQTGKIQEEMIDGIRYIWLSTNAYNPNSSLGRFRNILAFSFRCFFSKLSVSGVDMVICSSHHPFPIFAAHRYARKFNARLVFEVRDLWPLTLIELGSVSKHNPFIALMQRAEDYAYKQADKVVSVLPGAKNYMVGRGMKPDKFVFIPNGADLSGDTQKKRLPEAYVRNLKNLKESSDLIIGYVGKVGLSNAIQTLIEAIALCQDNRIVGVILGSGAYLPDLKLISKNLGLDEKIVFFDPLNKDQVSGFLEYLDVAYIGLQKKSVFRFGVSPTKLNDFMLAGKPIIYAIEAPGNIVEESGAGISCPAEDPEALSQAILTMKNMSKEDRDAMGKKGREWIIKNRDYKKLAADFLNAVFDNNP